MSGLVSGIGKVFAPVLSGVARVGQAVGAVGRTLFTAGAASGAGPMASGGLNGVVQSVTDGGVLGNVLSGAIKQAGYGALIGSAVGAMTGQGIGKGALMGGIGGALTGGITGALGGGGLTSGGIDAMTTGSTSAQGLAQAATPTGAAPTGSSVASSPMLPSSAPTPTPSPMAVAPTTAAPAGGVSPAERPGLLGGLGQFFQTERGGQMLAGLGQGIMAWQDQRSKEKMAEADRQFLRDKEQRLQDSYAVDPSVYHSASAQPQPQQPAQAGERRPRYRWDRSAGGIVYA